MQATTIKLENPLLNEVKKILPKHENITSFVRSLLEREIHRQKMIQAAASYNQFLKDCPDEREWLEDWDSLELDAPPLKEKKKRKA
ncbi:MAG: hypothetical protein JNK65_06205 [Deltaproteobacteria bacterium]|nr:hypothetical protein [Deltaproteobacteria bacterium]